MTKSDATFLSARIFALGLASSVAALGVSCGDPTGGDPPFGGQGGGSSGSSGNSGTGGVVVLPDAGTPECDGGVCSCIRIGMLGRLPTYGQVPGQDGIAALQDWLNTKSSAAVEADTIDTELTRDYLDRFDVIILQALEAREGGPYWNLSPAEIANVEAWVRAGGGLVTLTGYGGQIAEVNPTNQLVAFTGMAYNTDDVITACPDGCCYCAGNSVPMAGWNPSHPIGAHMTAVGAFHGRSIRVGDADVVAGGSAVVYAAAKQVDQGRVFMFGDEWVSYTSQWSSATIDASCRDPNHSCFPRRAEAYYQVPQFWYNALLWASGNPECFVIEDPTIVR